MKVEEIFKLLDNDLINNISREMKIDKYNTKLTGEYIFKNFNLLYNIIR